LKVAITTQKAAALCNGVQILANEIVNQLLPELGIFQLAK
jgi:hypothetical protein